MGLKDFDPGTATVTPSYRAAPGGGIVALTASPAIAERQDGEGASAQSWTKLAKREGWHVFHTYDQQEGKVRIPDLTMVHRVRGLVFAELKVPPSKATPDQIDWLEDLRAAGVRAFLFFRGARS